MDNIQNQTFELGEQNILEEFYELIEKHRLDPTNDFQLGDFYDFLSEFDLAYQKFNTTRENEYAVIYINKWLKKSLYPFLVLFKIRGFSNRPLFDAFKRFIYWFRIVLEHNQELNNEFFFSKNIKVNFPSLVQGEFINFLSTNSINFNLYKSEQFEKFYLLFQRAEYEISKDFCVSIDYEHDTLKQTILVFGDDFSINEFYPNKQFEKGETHYELTLDILLKDDENDGSNLINALSLLVNSISNIENVKVEIENIKTGSLYARIKIYLKDLVAKEETKAVLETSKESVIKALTAGKVSHAETKKANAETKKIKTEQELIEKEIESKPSEFESKISNALDLERKVLENEQLKIKLTKDKLEILDKLSDLATKGILEVDEIRIDINEILYLLKIGNEIETPETDIDQIT